VLTAVTLAAQVEPWQGLTAVVALAGVIVFLFKWADRRVTGAEAALATQALAHKDELSKCATREAQIRVECGERLAAQAREFADALRHEHADNRTHEDDLRKEFIGVVATIGDQTTKSAESLTEVLGKLHDRFTGSARTRH
jgi:ABC-type protease/lipase transport system fused ATPase/permease subunit